MCKLTKISEGIYEISETSNPFAKYMIQKKYGNEIKTKYMPSFQECMQQVDEWDEDYLLTTNDRSFRKGIPNLSNLVNKELGINIKNRKMYLYVYMDGTNNLVFEGESDQVAKRFNTSCKTITAAARDKRLFHKLYNIVSEPRMAIA